MAGKPAADKTVNGTSRTLATDERNPPFQGAAHGAGAGGSFVLQDVQRERARTKPA